MRGRGLSTLLDTRNNTPLTLRRLYNTNTTKEFRVAVLGFGPSGYYTANYINKELANSKERYGFLTKIDVIDRFAIGGGLVRSGVAPDHPEVKNVNRQLLQLFETTQENRKEGREGNEVSFFGNVEVGRSEILRFDKENLFLQIPFSTIQHCYHAIVICCGAEGERRLKIGEGIKGVYSAGSFVRYYNAGIFPTSLSHPSDFSDESNLSSFPSNPSLSSPTMAAAVIGHGNVGLDIARIILKGNSKEMQSTDITSRTLNKLSTSKVNTIHIMGRRGPVQSSFTTKELRELLDLQNTITYVCEEDIKALNHESQVEMKESRAKQRMIQLIASSATLLPFSDFISLASSDTFSHQTSADHFYHLTEGERDCDGSPTVSEGGGILRKKKKRCFIHYFANPHKYLHHEENNQKVLNAIEIERTKLTGTAHSQHASGTGEYYTFPHLVASFESIGYHQIPLFIHYPSSRHYLKAHQSGRVVNENGEVVKGVYTSGWYKRGPMGIVGSNILDAKETVASLISDIASLQSTSLEYNGIADLLKRSEQSQHHHQSLTEYNDWLRIEEGERERASHPSKPAEKFTNYQQILSFLSSLEGK